MFVEIANVMYIIITAFFGFLLIKHSSNIEVILEETQINEVFNTKLLFVAGILFFASLFLTVVCEIKGLSIFSFKANAIVSIEDVIYYLPYFALHLSGLWLFLVNAKFFKESFHPPFVNLTFMFLGSLSLLHFLFFVYRSVVMMF